MSKKQIKRIIFMGLGCAALLIAAVINSLLYNEGRWVKEMDMSTYVFTPKDIPMLAVGVLIAAYAVYILVLCIRNAFSKKYPDKKYSRTISPLWGFCGIFGFLGFGGFWTYDKYGEIFPFVFFLLPCLSTLVGIFSRIKCHKDVFKKYLLFAIAGVRPTRYLCMRKSLGNKFKTCLR